MFKKLENGWIKYWNDRVGQDKDYYDKKGANADFIIKYLAIQKKD